MRRGQDNDINVESLLDMLTNVVGFLVIVLALVQLNVNHGVNQALRSNIQQKIADARTQASAISRQLPRLREMTKHAGTRQHPDSLATLPSSREMTRQWRVSRAEAGRLESAIAAARDQLDAHQAIAMSRSEVLPNVRLVDFYQAESSQKRPAWVDKSVEHVICRGGRAFRIDGAGLTTLFVETLKEVTGETLPVSQSAWESVRSHFDRHDIGDEHIRLILPTDGSLRYEFRDDPTGEAEVTLQSGRSQLEEFLRQQITPQQAWLKCLVWDDSFQTYAIVRELAESSGYHVGWLPYGPKQRVTSGQAGSGLASGPHH